MPFFPHVDLSIQVLGFWFVWLFTVPSLRARKPGASEKVALDIAFLATPVVSFAMPFITKVGTGGNPCTAMVPFRLLCRHDDAKKYRHCRETYVALHRI